MSTLPTAPARKIDHETEAERRADLAAMKRRATGLLALVSLTWLVLLLVTEDMGWSGYAIAAAEAGMVGGLADWFAVTAVFRHPLGIPIPHTAVVAARKEQFGVTLGDFVQQNFLTADIVGQRIAEADLAERAGRWLSQPDNAALAAGHLADVVARLAEHARDEDMISLISTEIRRRVTDLDAAPAAGRLLKLLTVDHHHEKLLDELLNILDGFLVESEPALRQRFTVDSPWWLPEPIDEAIFQRLLAGVRNILAGATTPGSAGHGLRDQIHSSIQDFVTRLEFDPVLAEKAEELKQDILANEQVGEWVASIWAEVKGRIQVQATQPDSVLRARLTHAVVSVGRRLATDEATAARVDDLIEQAVRTGVVQFREEIAGLVSGTISRWDSAETSDRLELLLGRDLQFIRINGTVVGALAGLVIHLVGQLTG